MERLREHVLDLGASESDRREQLLDPALEVDRRADNPSTKVKSGAETGGTISNKHPICR